MIILFAFGIYTLTNKKLPIDYRFGSDNELILNLTGYYRGCQRPQTIYKSVEDEWVEIRGDLPAKGQYYLDGQFNGYGGCDYDVCMKLPKTYIVRLVEFNQTDTKNPPADSFSDGSPVPVYQTVPLSGKLKIEINFYSDPDCKHQKNGTITVTK